MNQHEKMIWFLEEVLLAGFVKQHNLDPMKLKEYDHKEDAYRETGLQMYLWNTPCRMNQDWYDGPIVWLSFFFGDKSLTETPGVQGFIVQYEFEENICSYRNNMFILKNPQVFAIGPPGCGIGGTEEW